MSPTRRGSGKSGKPPKAPQTVPVRIHAYGVLTVDVAGARLGRNADIVQSILLFLVCSPGMEIPRASVIGMLWPDSPDKRQRANLRQALYKMRLLGIDVEMKGDLVVIDGRQVDPSFSVRRDAASFEAQIVKGHEPFGPFLLGFDTSASAALNQWVEQQRDRAHADARRVLAQALRARHGVADWIGAEPLARWMLQFDPLNEAATLVMAECLVMAGAKYEAIRLLDRYMSELGPGAEDLRIPASTLRRRIASPLPRRVSFAPTERHFMGRDAVMADLTLCMRRAKHRDGTATLLHGPAGMGKTRVLNELSKVATLEGVRDVRTSCRETDTTRPLSVFLDIVPELMQMSGALGCSPESLQVLRRFTNDDAGAAERNNATPMLNLPLAASLRRAVIDLLMAVSEEKPTLLSIEDVHWLDSASWEVLVDLINRVGQSRVCLIMTSRLPHARPAIPERVPIELVIKELRPLSMESCQELVAAIGADLSANIDEDLSAWFVDTSEGVPLFLRSLVNHWIETGDAGGIPPTLLGVIGQRLQSLSSDALYVLQTVALLARHAKISMIEAVLEMPYYRIVSAIDDLHKAGAFDSDDDGIIVCHELIARLAVDRLGRNARRALHKRIADVMERVESQSGVSPLACRDRLGHLLAAGDRRTYLDSAIRGVSELLGAGYSYHALGVAEAALQHTGGDGERRNEVLALQAQALYESGEYAKLLVHPHSPSSVASGLEQLRKLSPDVAIRWIDSAAHSDVASQAYDLAAAAVMISEVPSYPGAVRYSAATLALRIASNACERTFAERAFLAGQHACAELEHAPEKMDELNVLYHTVFGDWKTAIDSAKELLARSYNESSPRKRLATQLHVAFCFRYGGLIGETIALLTAVHDESSTENLGTLTYFATWRLTLLFIDLDRLDLADYWLREFELRAPIPREPLAATLFHVTSVRLALLRHNVNAARYHDQRARESMPEDGHPQRHGTAIANQLGIARLENDIDETLRLVPIALSVYSKTQKFVGQAFLVSELALALVRVGRSSEAQTLLTDYVSLQRREPTPVPPFLAQTTEIVNRA